MQIDKILDKFGIYDLVAVLLSGICISTFSIFVLKFVYEVPINVNMQVSETFLFFIISYFGGLVFQESSSLIFRVSTNNSNWLLKSALTPAQNSNLYLEAEEKNGVKSYIQRKLCEQTSSSNSTEIPDNIIYNYCKFYIISNRDTASIDKDQSISAMARSLSLYFALLALVVPLIDFLQLYAHPSIHQVIQPSIIKIALVLNSVFLSVLLCLRYIRFAKLRYIKIVRFFYYTVVIKSVDTNTSLHS